MSTEDLHHVAATVIARARDFSGLSAAEFDFQIAAQGIGGPLGRLGNEVYTVANEHLPKVEPDADNRLDEREANHLRLWEALQPELQAYAERCRTRDYSGWSTAARSLGDRIRYAD